MLKTAVVYTPGSGGNFLYRVLNLSERFFNPGESDPSQAPTLTADQRLELLNNWISNNTESWKNNESLFQPGYRRNVESWCNNLDMPDDQESVASYVDYESSPHWFIDIWHPSELVKNLGVLWGDNFYETLIVIDSFRYRDFLLRNERTKKYTVNWEENQQALERCYQQFYDRIITVPFESFFEWALFRAEIENINQRLELDLDMDLVYKMWTRWYTKSVQIWR